MDNTIIQAPLGEQSRQDVIDGARVTDSDKDGIVNLYDNCPEIANPDQEDDDGNGIGDTCETGKSILVARQEEPLQGQIRDALQIEMAIRFSLFQLVVVPLLVLLGLIYYLYRKKKA